MSVHVNEAFKKLERLNSEIESFLKTVGDYCDDVEYDQHNLDEKFLRDELYGISDKLDDVKRKVNYLSKPVREQGFLSHNSDGRYELPSGEYFTSGSSCEILNTDGDEQEWLFTAIEHNGEDYYAVRLGRNVSINGLMARVRR